MAHWIETFLSEYNGNVVHEIKCSNCGYKVTYHGNKIPKRCYVCETEMHHNKGGNV